MPLPICSPQSSDDIPHRLLWISAVRELEDLVDGRPHRFDDRYCYHGCALRGLEILPGISVLEDVQCPAIQERYGAQWEKCGSRGQSSCSVSSLILSTGDPAKSIASPYSFSYKNIYWCNFIMWRMRWMESGMISWECIIMNTFQNQETIFFAESPNL